MGRFVMPNSRLEIKEDDFLTSIDHHDKFHENLLFDRSIYRPMCIHMGFNLTVNRKLGENKKHDIIT